MSKTYLAEHTYKVGVSKDGARIQKLVRKKVLNKHGLSEKRLLKLMETMRVGAKATTKQRRRGCGVRLTRAHAARSPFKEFVSNHWAVYGAKIGSAAHKAEHARLREAWRNLPDDERRHFKDLAEAKSHANKLLGGGTIEEVVANRGNLGEYQYRKLVQKKKLCKHFKA